MPDVIDSLEIQMSANVTSANKSLTQLLKTLNKLEATCGSMSATSSLVTAFQNISTSMTATVASAGNAQNAMRDLGEEMTTASANGRKGIDALNKSVKSLGASTSGIKLGSIKNLGSMMPNLSHVSTSASNSIASLDKSFTKAIISARAFMSVIRGVWRGLSSGIELASDLVEVQNVVDKAFGNEAYKVEELVQTSIKDLGMSELTAKEVSSRYQAMGVAMGISGSQVKKASDQIGTLREGYNSTASSMADMSINLTRLAADMASFYNVEVDKAAKDLQAVFTGQTRPLRTYGLDLTQATLQEWALKQGIDADVASMSQAEKTLLRYQYVMSQTKTIQGDFIDTADTWANRVKVLRQQFEALGAVIGSGLINALKPFVRTMNTVMDAVIEFSTNVMNALGKIFGWEYEVSGGGMTMDESVLDYTDSEAAGLEDVSGAADDAAGSVAKAAKANEEYKNTVLGFDELNKLNDVTSTGGSGSGSGSPSGSGKSGNGNSAVPSAVSSDDIEVSIKRTKALYESEIDNLYDLGKYIGNTLYNALASIDWDHVYEGAKNFGKGLADFLNGLITPDLFGIVGVTIASALNTVLYAFNSFTYNFEFIGLGASIAAGINGLLLTFNWNLLAGSLAQWKNGLYDTLYWAVAGIEWKNIGTSIGEGINTYFSEFNFGKMFHAYIKFALGLLSSLQAVFETVNWSILYENIKNAFESVNFAEVGVEIVNTIWTAIAGEQMSNQDYETVKGAFSDLEEILRNLASFTFAGIENLYTKVLKPMAHWVISIAFPYFVSKLKQLSDVIDWESAKDGLDKIFDGVSQFGEGIGKGLIEFFDGLTDFISLTLGMTIKFVAGAIDFLREKLGLVNAVNVKDIGEAFGVLLGAFVTYKITSMIVLNIAGLAKSAGALITAVCAHPYVAIMAAAAALGTLFFTLKNRVPDEYKDIYETADAVSKLTDALAADTIKEDKNYVYVMSVLGEYEKLNDKLLSGSDLTTTEETMLKSYLDILTGYVPQITEQIDTITGAYTGTYRELQSLIELEHARDLDNLYKKYLGDTLDLKLQNEANLAVTRAEQARAIEDALGEDWLSENGLSHKDVEEFLSYMEENGATATLASFDTRDLPDNIAAIRKGLYHKELSVSGWDYVEAVQKMENAIDEANEKIEILNGVIEEHERTLNKATREVERASRLAKESVNAGLSESEKDFQKYDQVVDDTTSHTTKSATSNLNKIPHAVKEVGDGVKEEGVKGAKNASEATVAELDKGGEEITESSRRAATGGGGTFVGVMASYKSPLEKTGGLLVTRLRKTFDDGLEMNNGSSGFFKTLGLAVPLGLKSGADAETPTLLQRMALFPGQMKTSLGNLFAFMSPSGVSAVSGLRSGSESQSQSLINVWTGLRNKMVGALSGMDSTLWTTGHNAVTSLKNGWTSVHIPTPHFTVSTQYSTALNTKVPTVAVGWYASGGLATEPSVVGIGEAGNEAIMPLDNPTVMQGIANAIVSEMTNTRAISDAVTKGIVSAGQNNDRPINLYATLRTENNEVLARAVAKGQQQIDYRNNPVSKRF